MKNTIGNALTVTLFGESHGEAIGAVTPSEIAVSIVAQLVRCRAERREGKDREAKRGKETA